MADEILPAITPDEWARGIVDRPPYAVTLGEGRMVMHGVGSSVIIPDDLRHPLAALCLDGQAFGFTRELVDRLRGAVMALRVDAQAFDVNNAEYAAAVEETIRLIEALLPTSP